MDRLIFGFILVLTLTASFGNAGKTSRSSLSPNITDWSGQNKDYELLEYLSFSSRFVPTALWADNTGDYGSVDSTDLMINPQCVIDSRQYVQALWNRTEWALSMFQASGKLPFDESIRFMIGNEHSDVQHAPGLFDQCVSASTSSPDGNIEGQYCSVSISAHPLDRQSLISIKSDDELSIYKNVLLQEPRVSVAPKKNHLYDVVEEPQVVIGTCLPASCSYKDLRTAVAYSIGRTIFHLPQKNGRNMDTLYSMVTSANEQNCIKNGSSESDSDGLPEIAFKAFFYLIGFLLVSSTFRDIWSFIFSKPITESQQDPFHMRVLQCFSIPRNIMDFLSTPNAGADDNIGCLHGIRVTSNVTLVVVHFVMEIFFRTAYNTSKLAEDISTSSIFPFNNPSTYVDNFLLLSGVLVCTSVLKDLDRGRFNMRNFFLNRYLRLTPLYCVILFATAVFAGRIGSGPNWSHSTYQSEDCRLFWWSHLLYINNWITPNITHCMLHTWFMAADMQLFLLSPLVIYPLWRWPRRAGPALLFMLLAASIGYSTYAHIAWDLPPTLILTRVALLKQVEEYRRAYYTNPFARCPPYLLGVFLGWILQRTRSAKIVIGKATLVTGWLLCVVAVCVIELSIMPYLDEKFVPANGNSVFPVVYGVFHRLAWAGVPAWTIFTCANGYGGILNDLLSSKFFAVFAKLCFASYLIHFNFIVYFASHMRLPFYFSSPHIWISAAGILLLTFVFSAVLVITIEMPFSKLQRFILPTSSAAKKNATATESCNNGKSKHLELKSQ